MQLGNGKLKGGGATKNQRVDNNLIMAFKQINYEKSF